MPKILLLEKIQPNIDFYLVKIRIYLNLPRKTTINNVTKIAKGYVVRKFMLINNARHKFLNIITYWDVKLNICQKDTRKFVVALTQLSLTLYNTTRIFY